MLEVRDSKDLPWFRHEDGWRRGGYDDHPPIAWGQLLEQYGPITKPTFGGTALEHP